VVLIGEALKNQQSLACISTFQFHSSVSLVYLTIRTVTFIDICTYDRDVSLTINTTKDAYLRVNGIWKPDTSALALF